MRIGIWPLPSMCSTTLEQAGYTGNVKYGPWLRMLHLCRTHFTWMHVHARWLEHVTMYTPQQWSTLQRILASLVIRALQRVLLHDTIPSGGVRARGLAVQHVLPQNTIQRVLHSDCRSAWQLRCGCENSFEKRRQSESTAREAKPQKAQVRKKLSIWRLEFRLADVISQLRTESSTNPQYASYFQSRFSSTHASIIVPISDDL